jgi:hypothetical protein
VRRRFEEHELRRAEAQDVARAVRRRRQRALDESADERIDLAEAAQRGGGEIAREGAVALLEPAAEARREAFVERRVAGEDVVEDGQRRAARGGCARCAQLQGPRLRRGGGAELGTLPRPLARGAGRAACALG